MRLRSGLHKRRIGDLGDDGRVFRAAALVEATLFVRIVIAWSWRLAADGPGFEPIAGCLFPSPSSRRPFVQIPVKHPDTGEVILLPRSDGQVPSIPVCPVCGEHILTELVTCSRCKTPHHAECWKYFGQCSTYACGSNRIKRSRRPVVARDTK